jgi:hypothetical protein
MEPQNYEKCTGFNAASYPVITVSKFTELKVYVRVRRTVSDVAIPKVLQTRSICEYEPGVGLRDTSVATDSV